MTGDEIPPHLGGIFQHGAAGILRVPDEDLAVGERYFHAVTVVHAALSLPPGRLAGPDMSQ
jgi:hypothetical protein